MLQPLPVHIAPNSQQEAEADEAEVSTVAAATTGAAGSRFPGAAAPGAEEITSLLKMHKQSLHTPYPTSLSQCHSMQQAHNTGDLRSSWA